MKSHREYLNLDQLIEYLEKEKKLIFPNENSKDKFKLYLEQYNYNFFVKGLKNKLMFDENGYYKKEFNSDQIRYLFDLDRRILVVIFKYFKSLELLLNNSFTSVIFKEIFKKTQTPYIAVLSKNEFSEIFSNVTKIYTNKIDNFDPLLNIVFEFFKYFYEESFFNETTFKNKDSENEFIVKKIENSWFIKNKNYLKNCLFSRRNWIYAEIFSITYLLSFGQIIKLTNSLNNDLKNQVLKNFFKKFNEKNKKIKIDETGFNIIIELFSNLRNVLAHNSNLIKFRYSKKIENTNFDVSKILGYKKEKIDEKIIINLNDTIILLEKIIGAQEGKIINEIKNEIQDKTNISLEKGNNLSNTLLQIIEEETGIKIKD